MSDDNANQPLRPLAPRPLQPLHVKKTRRSGRWLIVSAIGVALSSIALSRYQAILPLRDLQLPQAANMVASRSWRIELDLKFDRIRAPCAGAPSLASVAFISLFHHGAISAQAGGGQQDRAASGTDTYNQFC
jgi:hypothetical protein